jgi:hypothetical protein
MRRVSRYPDKSNACANLTGSFQGIVFIWILKLAAILK